ncbi:MAG: hypothetical protein ACP5QD_05940, partial [Candidatus Ratteibacteria bacterium]
PAEEKQIDMTSYVLTKPQILFSIKYGEQPAEVGLFVPGPEEGLPECISDFTVGVDGSIYVADAVNMKVKKFSRQGKLLMCTEDVLNGIETIGVNKKGWIFVVYFGDRSRSNQIAVYDEKGRRVSSAEERIRKLLTNVIVTKEVEGFKEIPGLTWVWCDPADNIHLRGGNFVYRISANLSNIIPFKNSFPYINGRYSYRLLETKKQEESRIYRTDGSVYSFLLPVLHPIEIVIYEDDGTISKKFLLSRGEFGNIEKMVPICSDIFFIDGKGNFYNIRSPLVRHLFPLRKGSTLFTGYFDALLEYDGNGTFVGVRAVINSFYLRRERQIELDSVGNVYYLDFKSDHVDVMMAPAPKR